MSKRKPEIVQLLVDAGSDPTLKNNDGETPLHFAQGCDTVNILLRRGADPNARTKWGSTPLHKAVEERELEIVQLLVDAGGDSTMRQSLAASATLNLQPQRQSLSAAWRTRRAGFGCGCKGSPMAGCENAGRLGQLRRWSRAALAEVPEREISSTRWRRASERTS